MTTTHCKERNQVYDEEKKKVQSLYVLPSGDCYGLTSILPSGAMIAYAADQTIKDKTDSASSTKVVMDAADVNTLEMDMSNATVTYSKSLSETGAAADWSNSETEKGAEKDNLGKAIAGNLDASKINGTDKSYWVKYSGIKMGEKPYDLEISVESAHGKISGAEGPYISFFKKNPASSATRL